MNKNTIVKLAFIIFCIINCPAFAQYKKALTDADKASLEGIIVEKYYTYNSSDVMDTAGGCLPKGAVTYRIYVDLKPNYTLQAVYGVTDHPLYIRTTTHFYNNIAEGQGTGDKIVDKRITGSSAAFDSWLTMGAATETKFGILKADDKDGSVLKINSMNAADGLATGQVKPVTYFGINPYDVFGNNNNASAFTTSNGSWAMFGGIKGATEDNKVLIAQITTDGKLSFEINLQIGTPTGGTVNYVAKNPQFDEIQYAALTY
ncbi:MAG: hypothetical protein ACXVPU_06685 [Bacteroidia bacterium]